MAATESVSDFLIVGAGLAGLACAGDLARAGYSVRLLDKGRGVGGRAATRRFAGTRTDHGAQYFTARGERLQQVVEAGLSEGWVREWCRGYPAWENGRITPRPDGDPRYTCPNGISDLPKHLAEGLTVETSATVTNIRREADETYVAETMEGGTWSGRHLILNLPPVQLLAIAKPLLPEETANNLGGVVFNPAWTLLLRLAADIPGADWPALEIKNHPVLGWLARDHTRRAPAGSPPVLVAHGTGDWSRDHLEDAPETVEAALRDAVTALLGPLEVVESQVHRWRYAQPNKPLADPFVHLPDLRIGACGDWCAPGGRVEGALQSGWGLAKVITIY